MVEQSDNVDVIERDEEKKQVAYKDAIERLKSLGTLIQTSLDFNYVKPCLDLLQLLTL